MIMKSIKNFPPTHAQCTDIDWELASFRIIASFKHRMEWELHGLGANTALKIHPLEGERMITTLFSWILVGHSAELLQPDIN